MLLLNIQSSKYTQAYFVGVHTTNVHTMKEHSDSGKFVKMLTMTGEEGKNGSPILETTLCITLDEISISFLSLGPRILKIHNPWGVSSLLPAFLQSSRYQYLELGAPYIWPQLQASKRGPTLWLTCKDQGG